MYAGLCACMTTYVLCILGYVHIGVYGYVSIYVLVHYFFSGLCNFVWKDHDSKDWLPFGPPHWETI